MGFFTRDELPFYYALAQTFAIDDQYHASVIGPTLPNRLYYMAAASFGHTTTGEAIPPIPAGYRPITGTLLDLMDKEHVSWMNYYSDLPSSGYLRPFLSEHLAPISQLATDLAAGRLADVTYIDADFGILGPSRESDEAPPNNIRRGQYFVAQNVAAIRNSKFWTDTIIVITYDEHGGCYDHVAPPPVRQHRKRTPDGIAPGQCADLSDPPTSEERGAGADMPGLRADWALSLVVPDVQPVRLSCPVHRGVAVREAALRVAYARRPHVPGGPDREAVHEPWRRWPAVSVADPSRRECRHARGSVRLRSRAVTRRHDSHGTASECRRRRVWRVAVRGLRCHLGRQARLSRSLPHWPPGYGRCFARRRAVGGAPGHSPASSRRLRSCHPGRQHEDAGGYAFCSRIGAGYAATDPPRPSSGSPPRGGCARVHRAGRRCPFRSGSSCPRARPAGRSRRRVDRLLLRGHPADRDRDQPAARPDALAAGLRARRDGQPAARFRRPVP